MGNLEIIDGLTPIIKMFKNDNDKLVKFIVENTYFINPILVIQQKKDLDEPYYVRFSEEKEYYCDKELGTKYSEEKKNRSLYEYTTKSVNKKRVPNDDKPLYIRDENNKIRRIIVDRDNNKKVREEINKYTHRKVSWGKDSNNMTNFVITHIWGKAYEPDYFSFMWNYCITPSFAASLTDKENPEQGSLEEKLQSTMKAIALIIYKEIIPENIQKDSIVKIDEDMKINLLSENGSPEKKSLKNLIKNSKKTIYHKSI